MIVVLHMTTAKTIIQGNHVFSNKTQYTMQQSLGSSLETDFSQQ